MNIEQSLFDAGSICLGPIDYEKDPQVEAGWTNDAGYLRMLSPDPALPLSAAQVKKRYEKIEKEQAERGNRFYFAIRAKADDRLIGFARLHWIEWSNGVGSLSLGIGAAGDRRQGYGAQALNLLLRYAFAELNLFRLSALVPEYNPAALGLFCKAGFVEEVRRREALRRDGRPWDMLHLGLLREEWERSQTR